MTSNPTGLNPTLIASGCTLWLDAGDSSSVLVSGSNVTQWNDKSGSGNNFTQATTASQPIYGTYSGNPSLSFIGTNVLNSSYIDSGSGARTTFIVFLDVNTPMTSYGNPVLFLMNSTNTTSGGDWRAAFGGATNALGIDIRGGSKLMSCISPVTSMRTSRSIGMWGIPLSGTVTMGYVYGNGVQFTAIVQSIGLTQVINVLTGTNTTLGGGGVVAIISEVIYYTKELTSAEREDVEGYLAWKWGLQSSLPRSHPYKFVPYRISAEVTPRAIPPNACVVPVNTFSTIKTLTLPVVSTNSGRLLVIKDYLGYSDINPIYLSTTGMDRIDKASVSSMVVSNSYGAWTFTNDGIVTWFLMNAYENTLNLYAQYVTNGLLYFVDVGNPMSYPGSGSLLKDILGSGNNMTLFGSPNYSSEYGGYLTFQPFFAQYAEAPQSLPSSPQFSVELWHYYLGGNTGVSALVAEVLSSKLAYAIGSLTVASPGIQVGFYMGYTGAGAGDWRASTAYTMRVGFWYHILGTFDGTNLCLYINGVLSGSVVVPSTPTPTSGAAGFRLMRAWVLASTAYWGGGIALHRFYNRALSADEVVQNFTASRARFGI